MRTRVLVVDDSAVIRRMLTEILGADPDVEVVATAASGAAAITKLAECAPDVVTLDVEMPGISGLDALVAIRQQAPRLPVIMFSSTTQRGAETTLEALARGATDYVTKPSGTGSREASIAQVRAQLVPKIKGLARRTRVAPAVAAATAKPRRRDRATRVDAVVLGCSTGGPNALTELLAALPSPLPVPIAIVQHMPPVFTRILADRLSARSKLNVREARDGEPLHAGEVLVAPGDHHLVLARDGVIVHARLDRGAPENSCRPAVDVLFRSAAATYGAGVLAVVLTGMGQDGLRGCELIRTAGGQIVVQDEATSVVWGMPGAIATAGLADQVAPIDQIADAIVRRTAVGRGAIDQEGRDAG
jgi:two-component system chemotaxis response regulator CheB